MLELGAGPKIVGEVVRSMVAMDAELGRIFHPFFVKRVCSPCKNSCPGVEMGKMRVPGDAGDSLEMRSWAAICCPTVTTRTRKFCFHVLFSCNHTPV